jgi:hypothetical protein
MSTPVRTSKEKLKTVPCTTQTLIESVKALHALVATVMADQAAMRRAIQDDPAFANSYEMYLKSAAEMAKPLLAEALESYDVLLEGVSSLEN